MTDFLAPLLGGILIGLGSLLALAVSGKIPGISGIFGKILRPSAGDTAWRVVFLVGLIAGAGLLHLTQFGWQEYRVPGGRNLAVFVIAGLLVGFGTRMGGGCTSGHGVCGIGAGAKDGLIYTLVFMATGIATVFAWNLLAHSSTPVGG